MELGLTRMPLLLPKIPPSWRSIHVAGTNGKGTVCAYLSAFLRLTGISYGRFTSPHLLDIHDSVHINGETIAKAKFEHYEAPVRARNARLRAGATHFELLTATAFEAFEGEKVEVGVVEVGLGGEQDATNVLANKHVTVISKIGLDHQGILGNTVEEIARHKAGIMRKGVPCLVDASNWSSVLAVLESHGKQVGAEIRRVSPSSSSVRKLGEGLETHQRQNLALAWEAFRLVCPEKVETVPVETLHAEVRRMIWPGRLQTLCLGTITGRKEPALLDGAHNPQSAQVLADYVNKHLRSCRERVTWVVAVSNGRDPSTILKPLLQPGDAVVAVEFGAVQGMPWCQPLATSEIIKYVNSLDNVVAEDAGKDVVKALELADGLAGPKGPSVIAGSLYLAADVLRLLRDAESVT